MTEHGEIEGSLKNGDSDQRLGESKVDKGKKVLKMGTSADYPPFEYIDTAKGTGEMRIDVDIAKAITEKLGYGLKIQDMDFGGLISALQNGQDDFATSAMTATEKRKKSVDFSDIYYTSKHIIVSKKDSGIQSVEDLKGKNSRCTNRFYSRRKSKGNCERTDIKVDNRNRIPELIQEIKAGRMDAAIIEDTVAEGYLEKIKILKSLQLRMLMEAMQSLFQKTVS